MNKTKKLWLVIVMIAAIAAAGFGGWYFMKSSEPTAEEVGQQIMERYSTVKDSVVTQADEDETISDDPVMERSVDFEALHEINEDIYAWIYIPGTDIDYPILRSEDKDDSYYLEHTMDGVANPVGSVYVESISSADFSDGITPIYGHTLFNFESEYGTMFTPLASYMDAAFLEEHPYIYIYTPENTYRYEVFNVSEFDDRYIPYAYNVNLEEDVQSYILDVKGQINSVSTDMEVNGTDKIIVLSTCTDPNASQRLLVSAALNGTLHQ